VSIQVPATTGDRTFCSRRLATFISTRISSHWPLTNTRTLFVGFPFDRTLERLAANGNIRSRCLQRSRRGDRLHQLPKLGQERRHRGITTAGTVATEARSINRPVATARALRRASAPMAANRPTPRPAQPPTGGRTRRRGRTAATVRTETAGRIPQVLNTPLHQQYERNRLFCNLFGFAVGNRPATTAGSMASGGGPPLGPVERVGGYGAVEVHQQSHERIGFCGVRHHKR
jgi:hypothetical protein